MWDFSGDEWAFVIVAGAAVAFLGWQYYRPLVTVAAIRKARLNRAVLSVLPIAALIPTCLVLCRWADPQVVGHLDYTVLFLLGGAACIVAATRVIELLGVSIRDDSLERNNTAATITACGFVFSVGIVYAHSNVGAGPTIWTTIWPALAASVLVVLTSLLVEFVGEDVADAIAIDRDIAAALRFAGALVVAQSFSGEQ